MNEQPTIDFPDFGKGVGVGPDTKPTPVRRALAWNPGTDLGLLVLRFAVGAVFFAHGMQKIFGMWGYPGIDAFTGTVAAAGYQPAAMLAWLTGIVEIIGGAFLVLGILTPLVAAALLAIKLDAVLVKLAAGTVFLAEAGPDALEFDVVLGAAAFALVLTGPGHIALDNGRPWHRRPLSWAVLALIVGIAAGVLVFVFLHHAQPGAVVG